MKFAIATVDRHLAVFQTFVKAGWRPLKLFTVPVTSAFDNQAETIAYAARHKIAIQLSKLTPEDLAGLMDQGCEALIVASYNWKICDWRPYIKYAVNFHNSPLPDGRGAYPLVQAVLEGRRSWGVACHQITPDLDKGAVLDSLRFPLEIDECHESLSLKVQMKSVRLASRVANDFVRLWENAQPQADGSYWPKPKLEDLVVDLNGPFEQSMRRLRAIGALGSLVNVDRNWLIVFRAIGWSEQHADRPGETVYRNGASQVVAANGGYIGLLDSRPAPIELVLRLNEIALQHRSAA